MNLDKLKAANQIYELLADKSYDEAMYELKTFEEIDPEVLNLVKSLITNSGQPSAVFEEKFIHHFQQPANINWQAGDSIGDYELLELIGQGGMAVVFKAQRIDSQTQKPVAIKVFNLSNRNQKVKAKFLSEQQILAKLTHPHIIDFHHGGKTERGDSFLVMELISGSVAIDQYIRDKRLSDADIISLIIQAAEALQYAHNHLIIHRDIKPSNLLINNNGQLKVLDFGIAKLINPDQAPKSKHNEDTLLALTPKFAAPEQINNQSINTTTDIFSLAAVATLLLTGKDPFPNNRILNACAEDEAQIRQLLNQYIDDQDLRNILSQALKADPQHRYPNMFAFREDLQAWLENKPVSATQDSWWYRMRCLASRRTALFSTSLLLGFTVLAAVFGLSHQNTIIINEAKKAEAVKNFMLDSFSVTDPSYSQGVDISSKDLLRVAADKIDADNEMDDTIKFELKLAMGLAHGRLGFYPEAISLLKDALSIKPDDEQVTALLVHYQFNAGQISDVNQLLSNTDESTYSSVEQQTAIKRVRANILAQAGKHQQAIFEFNQLTELSNSQEDYIQNQSLLAEIHYLNGDSAQSVAIIEQLKKDHPLNSTDVTNLGLNSDLVQYYDQVGNFTAAMQLTEQNIDAFKSILGDQHPDLGLAYNALSVFQRLAGKLDVAITSAKKSEQIYRQRYGNSSEGLAQALSNIGVAQYYNNQPEDASDNLTVAADMLSHIFGEEHPEAIDAKANLAIILNAVGYPEKALPVLQQIHQIESRTLGKHHRSAINTRMSLALTLANLDQFDPAIVHAKDCIQLITENYPNEANFINHSHSILGRVYFMADEHKLAIEHNLIHINNWTQGDENNLARSLQLVAGSYQAINAFDQADMYFELWTDHLLKIYGQTNEKYLNGLLIWAERALQMKAHEQSKILINQTHLLLNESDLDYESIHLKLNELKSRLN